MLAKAFWITVMVRMPGVKKAMAVPGAIAVIADSYWQAKQAVDSMAIDWDMAEASRISDADIFKQYEYDFYKIDPGLFSPARVLIMNLRSGRCWSFGGLRSDLIAQSFGCES